MSFAPSPRLRALFAAGTPHQYLKGEVIQSSDDHQNILFLKSGYVKRYMITTDGSLGVQAIFGPGDVFPLTLIFKEILGQRIYSGPEVHHYEAMTPVEIVLTEAEKLKMEVAKDQQLYKDLFTEAGERLESNIQRLENLAMKTADKKVAHQLLYFAHKFGEDVPEGRRILIPLTQQDIADTLSLTRETVSQAIAQLRKDKLIKTVRGITVTNLDKLEEIAYS